MIYTDFKIRYSILGQQEIDSSSDNKVATFALMDKVGFGRDRYRLGHTLIFFRAGGLAYLEETRDNIVGRLLRLIQGAVYKRIRGVVFKKKLDQRELIKVAQKQFRKFQSMREWGWFAVIQKTKPLIGLPDPMEELRVLGVQHQKVYGAYKEKIDLKAKLLAECEQIVEDKKSVMAQIAEEQSGMSEYHERQEKCARETKTLNAALVEAKALLAKTEDTRKDAENAKKDLESGGASLKNEIADMEVHIARFEQDMANKEHTIKSLNDEIADRDEVINKLNKEKKHISESGSKSSEELNVATDKLNHMNKIKDKLEATLDELELALEREKKAKASVDKERRKAESNLKVAHATATDMERTKKEVEENIKRKDNEVEVLASNLTDEQCLVGKVQKQIKEFQGRVEELEEEVEAERQARAKAERQRSDLCKEKESLDERLQEAGGANSAQVELNRKRDVEVGRLRKDQEEVAIQHQAALEGIKKRQGDSITEMTDQMDQLNKMRTKYGIFV